MLKMRQSVMNFAQQHEEIEKNYKCREETVLIFIIRIIFGCESSRDQTKQKKKNKSKDDDNDSDSEKK